MAQPVRVVNSIIAFAFAVLPASAGEPRQPAVALIVYDQAAVPTDVSRRAATAVIRIYKESGVDVAWIDPIASPEYRMINPNSNSPEMFVIQFMIRRRASAPGAQAVMGTALGGTGDNGGMVHMFYDQVLKTAHRYHQPVYDILAQAIAHEVGHVLLPFPAHSPTGIMRAYWDGDDIRHAMNGTLTFTSAQAGLIREKVSTCCAGQSVVAPK
jgi:hypothetical protein